MRRSGRGIWVCPRTSRCSRSKHHLSEGFISDDAIDTMPEYFSAVPSPHTVMGFQQLSDSEEKMLKAVLPAVLPGILRSRMQDSPYNAAGGAAGQAPAADEKFWGR